jgi:hypothetical protein
MSEKHFSYDCSSLCPCSNIKRYLFHIVASSIYLLCKTVNQLLSSGSLRVHDNATDSETIFNYCSCTYLPIVVAAWHDHGFQSNSEHGWISTLLSRNLALDQYPIQGVIPYIDKEILGPENWRHLVILGCSAIQTDINVFIWLYLFTALYYFIILCFVMP